MITPNGILSNLQIGKDAVLDSFQITPIHQRLLAMGISPGVRVRIIRKMARQGNLYVRIGDRNLALRKAEADLIKVKEY